MVKSNQKEHTNTRLSYIMQSKRDYGVNPGD